jgi:putative CocE/NonD family hydrolase
VLDSRSLLAALLLGVAVFPLLAAEKIPSNPFDDPKFTKPLEELRYVASQHRIPMRDGVKLFTLILAPKDGSEPLPIILQRTPYGIGEGLQRPFPRETWQQDKFIRVFQHVRGRYLSEGTFTHMRPFNPTKGPTESDESSDAWDTIDWLVKNVPNNNGRVGITGCSYHGFYASMGMINSHPALQAATAHAPIADFFMGDDLHHNGALILSKSFTFHSQFERPTDNPLSGSGTPFPFGTRDGYDFYLRMGPVGNSEKLFQKPIPAWREFLAHPNYDAFWQSRNIRPHLKNIRCPVLIVGGWYDAEDLFGTLETYRWTERQNPGIPSMLVMGPWSHLQWLFGKKADRLGPIEFGTNLAAVFQNEVHLPFFRHFLKGDTNYVPTKALMFQTGANKWRRFDAWPPRNMESKTIFFQSDGKLAFTPQGGGHRVFDEFLSDPTRPVPFTKEMNTGYAKEFMVEDQRFAATRPDVLVYETEPLSQELTIAGPIRVSLHVSTTGTDADWVVKLIDVYAPDFPDPDPNPTDIQMGGYQQLVRGDVMRSRFRDSFERPRAMKPGQVTKIEFTMSDVLHTFRRGHRVMVQVQSSWFPFVDRNPQTFVPNIAFAKPEDFRKATHRVYHSDREPSAVTVGIIP